MVPLKNVVTNNIDPWVKLGAILCSTKQAFVFAFREKKKQITSGTAELTIPGHLKIGYLGKLIPPLSWKCISISIMSTPNVLFTCDNGDNIFGSNKFKQSLDL